jgi:hypothetical protein
MVLTPVCDCHVAAGSIERGEGGKGEASSLPAPCLCSLLHFSFPLAPWLHLAPWLLRCFLPLATPQRLLPPSWFRNNQKQHALVLAAIENLRAPSASAVAVVSLVSVPPARLSLQLCLGQRSTGHKRALGHPTYVQALRFVSWNMRCTPLGRSYGSGAFVSHRENFRRIPCTP